MGERGCEEFEWFVLGGLSYDIEIKAMDMRQDIIGILSLKWLSSL